MNSPRSGFTLTALLVIIVTLAVLAVLLLPALTMSHDDKAERAERMARRIYCVNNLKQAGLAYRIWEGDHGGQYPMAVSTANGGTMEFTTGENTFRHFQVMSNELSTPKILICPADTRTAADNFSYLRNDNVSYFVDLDADESHPQRFLDGDRNLIGTRAPENGILKLVPGQFVSWTGAMHGNDGNVGLTDGSVQQFSDDGVQAALKNSGDATNVWRISLPE
jgi:type II secretory pathway pseudopilin PulG